MRVAIVAAGRIKSGPERALVDDYLKRANRAGRAIGIHPITEIEIEPKAGDARARTETLLGACPEGSLVVALDERGRALASDAFANKIADWRDGGARDLAFVIGEADGLDQVARERADFVLALGPQTWPHKLVRAMIAEQLYRAVAILSGSPYHRA
ncbi:MAG: 23S rRNA (pseudouridine(1915)-N(3))-methyltransferase RlmH [Maricaulaceae bacterium]